MDERKLTNDVMPEKEVQDIRLDMERAEAQRLQPHHIQSFFIEAFKHLGGNIKQREEGRFEIINVPVRIRERDRLIGIGTPIGKNMSVYVLIKRISITNQLQNLSVRAILSLKL